MELNGTEFINKEFRQLLDDNVVVIGTSAPKCAEQNGRIEPLSVNNFPKYLWAEAVITAVYALK